MAISIDILTYAFEEDGLLLGVSLTSLFENNPELRANITLINEGIKSKDLKKIDSTVKKYKSVLTVLDAKEINKSLKKDKLPTNCCTRRLSIINYIAKKGKNFLLISPKSLIVGNIEKLFDLDIKKKPFAAKLELVNKPETRIVSKDLILFNSKVWDKSYSKLATETIRSENLYTTLNIVANDDFTTIPPKFCVSELITIYSPSIVASKLKLDELVYYSNNKLRDAIAKPLIVFFDQDGYEKAYESTEDEKEDNSNPFYERWNTYFKLSAWKKEKLEVSTGKVVTGKIGFLEKLGLKKLVNELPNLDDTEEESENVKKPNKSSSSKSSKQSKSKDKKDNSDN